MDFSITSIINIQDYIKAMFIGLYKKPYYMIATIFGLCLLSISTLNYFDVIIFEVYSPITDAVLGLFLLLSPSIIVLFAVRQVKSNPSFLNEMTYTFTDKGVSVIGLTFKSEFLWEYIIKQKEIGKFLVLYHTKKYGSFIDKSRLDEHQLFLIRSKIARK